MREELSLGEELTIYEASALQQRLLQAMQAPDGLCADLSAVAEIDTAAVQVLIWAQREGLRRGIPVSYRHPSPAVRDYLALLGLETALHFAEGTA